MSAYFEKVKSFVVDLDLTITSEDEAEELVIVDRPEDGIVNLVIDCEDPILIIEQLIMPVPNQPGDLFKQLLKMNRTLVHGAFLLDEDDRYIIFRDTLQLANLDLNELEGSVAALSLAMAEYGPELLEYVKTGEGA